MILKARPKADPLNAQQRTAKAAATIHLCYHHPKPNQADAPHSIQNKQRKTRQRLITDMGTPRPLHSTGQKFHQSKQSSKTPCPTIAKVHMLSTDAGCMQVQ
jgi:hypothetical protein